MSLKVPSRRNFIISNILIFTGVMLALYFAGVPTSLYKGFVSVHMALLTICGISGFAVASFENYIYAFQSWKRLFLASIASVFLVTTTVTFVGWPAFGAIYALYFWLSA